MNRQRTYRVISFVVFMCMALFSVASTGQEHPKAEVFGGYQFTRIGGVGGVNASGWNAAVNGNVNKWFGLTGDFSAAYKSIGGADVNAYTYTFGPTFSARGDRVTPFAHALIGGFRASAGFQGLSASTSGFTMMFGGGVDVGLTKRVAVRVIQPDWIIWRTHGITEKQNVRISTGLVFRF